MNDYDEARRAWRHYCSDDKDDAYDGFCSLKYLADKGNVEASYSVGCVYEDTDGVVECDLKKAEVYFRKAAEQGHVKAQQALGRLLYECHPLFGRIDRDYSESAKWTRKAAEQDDWMAQSLLGSMYQIGCGVPKDEDEAMYWYGRAARYGDRIAQKVLRNKFRCQHCGGFFKGFFNLTCENCGRKKDY